MQIIPATKAFFVHVGSDVGLSNDFGRRIIDIRSGIAGARFFGHTKPPYQTVVVLWRMGKCVPVL